jgi:hypothetical protein
MTSIKKLEIIKNQDSIFKWFNDSIIKNNNDRMHRARLYGNYKSYCKEKKYFIMKKSEVLYYIYEKLGQPLKNCDYTYKGYQLISLKNTLKK